MGNIQKAQMQFWCNLGKPGGVPSRFHAACVEWNFCYLHEKRFSGPELRELEYGIRRMIKKRTMQMWNHPTKNGFFTRNDYIRDVMKGAR